MSGVVKGVKKVFKKVWKAIKPIVTVVAIAVAAYFTAGVALSFIPATSAFAASLPGFAGGGLLGTGIGAGATAGTGIFSSAASAIGLGGGLAAGAGAGATSAAATAAGAGFFPSTATVAAGDTLGVLGGINAGAGVAGAGAAAGAGGVAAGAGGAALAKVGMSLTDKLLLAKVGTDVAGAMFGPSPEDMFAAEAEENAKFRGAFYGMEADGSMGVQPPSVGAPSVRTGPEPVQEPLTPQQQLAGPGQKISAQQPGVTSALTPQVAPKTPGLFNEAPDGQVATAQPTGNQGQMQTQINAPSGLFAPTPGVRYV